MIGKYDDKVKAELKEVHRLLNLASCHLCNVENDMHPFLPSKFINILAKEVVQLEDELGVFLDEKPTLDWLNYPDSNKKMHSYLILKRILKEGEEL